jgi:hypothetical protein
MKEDIRLPEENCAREDSKLDRRDLARRMGKFFAYTAPAPIALATAKDAGAGC